jgi:hypothetical protein
MKRYISNGHNKRTSGPAQVDSPYTSFLFPRTCHATPEPTSKIDFAVRTILVRRDESTSSLESSFPTIESVRLFHSSGRYPYSHERRLSYFRLAITELRFVAHSDALCNGFLKLSASTGSSRCCQRRPKCL